MASIPLQCICCAKKPKFSDVSHLLTHIQSKGHLSQYYKLKIKSGNDAEARVILDEYDQWYADWDVEHLMQERMSLKNKKQPRPRALASSRANSRTNSTAPRPTSRPNNRFNAGYLDPRLSAEQHIKTEPRPTPPYGSPHLYPAYLDYNWPPVPAAYILRSQRTPIPDWMGDHMSESSGLTSLPATESTTETRVSSHDDTVSQVTSLDTVDEHAVAECAKLKGVVHEGMGLFDSATPEMKRKRNQKKDVSVLARLELNSIEVEATELVWSSPSLGNLKRMKPITGNPDSDEDTSSSPTKYSPRKRARTGSPGRRPLAAIKDEHDHDGFVQSGRSRTRMQFETSRNERIETHLNYGTGMRRQRFEIYHDEDEDEDENVYPRATTAATFSHPTPLHYLTAPLGQFSGPRLPQTPFQGPSQALFPGPLQALFQGPSQAQFQSHSQAQFQAHSPAQFQSHPQTQLPGPHLYNPFGTHISPLKTQMSPSRFGFQSTNTNAFYRDEKENLNFGPVQPAPFQPNFCSPGFTMSQYHIPPQQTNNYPPAVWSTPGPFHMSYFSQQPMEGLSPIKLSPLKLNREMSDDERTITAPPSDD